MSDENGELRMCDGRLCPIIATFDAAENFIGDYADVQEEPEANLGVIKINRKYAERVQEVYPCRGPNMDMHGSVHCPLSTMIGDAFQMAAYPFAPRTDSAREGSRCRERQHDGAISLMNDNDVLAELAA
jgi:hypothetical protein